MWFHLLTTGTSEVDRIGKSCDNKVLNVNMNTPKVKLQELFLFFSFYQHYTIAENKKTKSNLLFFAQIKQTRCNQLINKLSSCCWHFKKSTLPPAHWPPVAVATYLAYWHEAAVYLFIKLLKIKRLNVFFFPLFFVTTSFRANSSDINNTIMPVLSVSVNAWPFSAATRF